MIEKVSLFDIANNTEEDTTYTTKTSVPQYEPHNECPSVYSLCDIRKYEKLVYEINSSNISDEDKEFLKLAATRHIVFNYSKIADYYCYASKEVQQLMEDSALVLIDIDDAIVNGYVKLDKKLTKMAADAFKKRQERDKNKEVNK